MDRFLINSGRIICRTNCPSDRIFGYTVCMIRITKHSLFRRSAELSISAKCLHVKLFLSCIINVVSQVPWHCNLICNLAPSKPLNISFNFSSATVSKAHCTGSLLSCYLPAQTITNPTFWCTVQGTKVKIVQPTFPQPG